MSSVAPSGSLPAKSLYDTSIYINAIRSQAYYERLFPHFSLPFPRRTSVPLLHKNSRLVALLRRRTSE